MVDERRDAATEPICEMRLAFARMELDFDFQSLSKVYNGEWIWHQNSEFACRLSIRLPLETWLNSD